MPDIDYRVVRTVDNQQRAPHLAHVRVIWKFVEGQQGNAGHDAECRDEGALKNQRPYRLARSKVNSGSAAHRASEDNDVLGRDLQVRDQVIVGSILVVVSGLLAGLALAGAIALVVIGKDTEAGVAQS